MSTLSVGTIQSNTTSPPTINNSAGTQIGTFCRAWVNFNGTGAVAIREDFNVSSITDHAAGDYSVIFTTAMPDANYSITIAGQHNTATVDIGVVYQIKNSTTYSSLTTTSARLYALLATDPIDPLVYCVAVFR